MSIDNAPSAAQTRTPHLDALVEDLRAAFSQPRSKERAQRVLELMRSYSASHEDWREFLFLDPSSYTRNQVAREAEFELLILGWNAGQESPIHNHEGEDCWMAVLEGDITEVRYAFPKAGAGPGPPPVMSESTFHGGQVAFIRDEIGLHLVKTAGPERAGISLHLYAKPYDQCDCYCPETGKITRKDLTYFSKRGVRVED